MPDQITLLKALFSCISFGWPVTNTVKFFGEFATERQIYIVNLGLEVVV